MEKKSLAQRLDEDFAEAWQPDPGDKLIGRVVALDEREGIYGFYPIVTIERDDGEHLAVYAFHDVLANELARLKPKTGTELGIKYLGKDSDRGYHKYKVLAAGEKTAKAIEWDKYKVERETDVEESPEVNSAETGETEISI